MSGSGLRLRFLDLTAVPAFVVRRNRSLVPIVRTNMSSRNAFIDDRIYQYILDHSLRELPVLEQLRQVTEDMPSGRMQVSPDQGQLMALIVRLTGARRIVEVGTFTGYSSTVMALALPEGGSLVACDVSTEYTDVARQYWQQAGVAEKIELRLGPAEDTLSTLLKEGQAATFDLAFIDADKESYGVYYEKCLELLHPGGLIMIDNVLWSGRTADPAINDEDTVAIRELNAFIHRDERVDCSLLSVGDGLTLARKR
jgi:predicted O-methyltransferase YrrM